MTSPIGSFQLAFDSAHPTVPEPVAIRLATDDAIAWLVAAAPKDEDHAREDLYAGDIWLGFDEVIVLFTDARAHRLGLLPAD
jgi:hypothetical protein